MSDNKEIDIGDLIVYTDAIASFQDMNIGLIGICIKVEIGITGRKIFEIKWNDGCATKLYNKDLEDMDGWECRIFKVKK